MEDINHLLNLIKQYRKGIISPQDSEVLQLYTQQYPAIKELIDQLDDENFLIGELRIYQILNQETLSNDNNGAWSRLQKRLEKDQQTSDNIYYLNKWLRIGIAAAILMMGFLSIWKFTQQKEEQLYTKQSDEKILVGSNKAILTMPGGKTVDLNGPTEGVSTVAGLTYLDGTPVTMEYQHVAQGEQLSLVVPRGGQYHIILPDGTKVYLNSDSRLDYPKEFSTENRKVRLTGEAYFEVTHNPQKPFIVETKQERIQVLGTKFNASCYANDDYSRVTLLSGKVKVSLPNNDYKILSPGQQSINDKKQLTVQQSNLDEELAWKNGEFLFVNRKLEDIMKKLARWYDFDYELGPEVRDILIWASISKYTNLNEVLQTISSTNQNIKIKIIERKVYMNK